MHMVDRKWKKRKWKMPEEAAKMDRSGQACKGGGQSLSAVVGAFEKETLRKESPKKLRAFLLKVEAKFLAQ